MPKEIKKEIKEKDWEKDFEEQFGMYNPIHDDGKIIPGWNGRDYEGIKSFIRQLLFQEKKKWMEDLYLISWEIAYKKNQVIGEKNDYYINLNQLMERLKN